MEQAWAWYVSLFLLTLVAGLFLWVRVYSTRASAFEPIRERAYHWRPRLFWGLVILGVPVMGVTLTMLPYGAVDGVSADALQVEVEGRQFAWSLSATQARVGQTVIFNVTSADVNHGFGIYDTALRLRAQTQAMPGYTNRLVHVFDEPGSYRILCLEYCGVAHHAMEATFEVTAAE